jgi:hypothetical protein
MACGIIRVAPEIEAREGVAGKARHDHHDDGDGNGHDQRIDEELAEGQMRPGLDEVLPMGHGGQQARREGQHLVIGAQRVADHPEEGKQEEKRDHGQGREVQPGQRAGPE